MEEQTTTTKAKNDNLKKVPKGKKLIFAAKARAVRREKEEALAKIRTSLMQIATKAENMETRLMACNLYLMAFDNLSAKPFKHQEMKFAFAKMFKELSYRLVKEYRDIDALEKSKSLGPIVVPPTDDLYNVD